MYKIVLIKIPKTTDKGYIQGLSFQAQTIHKSFDNSTSPYSENTVNQTNLNIDGSKDGDGAAYVVVFKCICILVYNLLVEAYAILFSLQYFTLSVKHLN